MNVELLWSSDCPNYRAALDLVEDVISQQGISATMEMIEISDIETGRRHRFPGSPTIRVDGLDVDPAFDGCDDDCTPRCRVYQTRQGIRGLPEREWIEWAIIRGSSRRD